MIGVVADGTKSARMLAEFGYTGSQVTKEVHDILGCFGVFKWIPVVLRRLRPRRTM
ncbi:hypothetical protein RISK_005039 [Rhodopirellula islandica]|uniref:Uncharacterized protein n=2 Tax=Rhodopirellula islandica TaxID=595434 RepID=A0A0J1B844_RHOIS|nr:hypothetical protein RISK_005039 [Rhodopirellula islandica]